MILEFDLGNSAVKWRTVAGGGITASGRFVLPDIELAGLCDEAGPVCARAVSVAGAEPEALLSAYVKHRFGLSLHFARVESTAAGVANSYADPSKMGADRWSAIVAARHLVQGPAVVIDAGSALTIDLLGADGRHLGGYIGAGLGMMRGALLRGTSEVRFDAGSLDETILPGDTTGACVAAGTLLALRGSVAVALRQAATAFSGDPFRVLLCGGDAELLGPEMDRAGVVWEVAPDLVFAGLQYLCPQPGELCRK